MNANRIKRLILLIAVIALTVFGGLAINAYWEVQGFRKLYFELLEEKLKRSEECKTLISLTCDRDWLTSGTEFAAESLTGWESDYELYKSLAIYVPLGTIVLYFACLWIWFGKFTSTERVSLTPEPKKNIVLFNPLVWLSNAYAGTVSLWQVFVFGRCPVRS